MRPQGEGAGIFTRPCNYGGPARHAAGANGKIAHDEPPEKKSTATHRRPVTQQKSAKGGPEAQHCPHPPQRAPPGPLVGDVWAKREASAVGSVAECELGAWGEDINHELFAHNIAVVHISRFTALHWAIERPIFNSGVQSFQGFRATNSTSTSHDPVSTQTGNPVQLLIRLHHHVQADAFYPDRRLPPTSAKPATLLPLQPPKHAFLDQALEPQRQRRPTLLQVRSLL